LSEIPQIVKEFIQSYIGSVDALEVLFTAARHAGKGMGTEEDK
jgi:hypothetical protein